MLRFTSSRVDNQHNTMAWILFSLFKFAVIVALCAAGVHYWMQNKSFNFSDKIVEEIALHHLGKLACIRHRSCTRSYMRTINKLKVKVDLMYSSAMIKFCSQRVSRLSDKKVALLLLCF